MERDGQLSFHKYKGYSLIDQNNIVTGTVNLHPDGFAFVSYSTIEKDLFLPANQVSHVFDGDVVQVLMSPPSSNSGSGQGSFNRLIKVLERKTTHIVGELKRKGSDYYLIPDCSKISFKIDVDERHLMDAKEGQYVSAEILEYPGYKKGHQQTTLKQVTDVLGNPQDPGMEITVALHRHGILDGWTDEEFDLDESYGDYVDEKDKLNRVDYRHLSLMTINGADARDFDDASIIRTMLLRSQSQALYSPKNDDHFGLVYDAYSH